MRHFYFALIVLISSISFGQFNYQSILKDNSGAVIKNTQVNLRFNIYYNSTSSNWVYSEEHSVSIGNDGVINLEIGTGNTRAGSINFNEIKWANNPLIETEVDASNTGSYSTIDTSNLNSVPISEYSKSTAGILYYSAPTSNIVSITNLVVSNIVTATSFWGDGSGLSFQDNQGQPYYLNQKLSQLSNSSTDSQTIFAALNGTTLELLPQNTTVSATVDLSYFDSSGTDSQTIFATLNGTTLELLPQNTTVSATVDLSYFDSSGTDSQTINVALNGTTLELLPQNTTVSATVDLSYFDSSGTDSQTIDATLNGTTLELLPQNTTVSATVDLAGIFSNLSLTVSGTSVILFAPDGTIISSIKLSKLNDGLIYTIDGF